MCRRWSTCSRSWRIGRCSWWRLSVCCSGRYICLRIVLAIGSRCCCCCCRLVQCCRDLLLQPTHCLGRLQILLLLQLSDVFKHCLVRFVLSTHIFIITTCAMRGKPTKGVAQNCQCNKNNSDTNPCCYPHDCTGAESLAKPIWRTAAAANG